MKKGQIIYSQGEWKCKFLEDYGETISYLPLEGVPENEKGEIFTASKSLFSIKKDKNWGKNNYPSQKKYEKNKRNNHDRS